MFWSDITKRANYGDAPQNGEYIIYTRKKVVSGTYRDLSELDRVLADADVLEVHLYDEAKEYRGVASMSSRYPEGWIDIVTDFKESEEDTYKETVCLENGRKLVVLNHIQYNENGMAIMDDYRLKKGE